MAEIPLAGASYDLAPVTAQRSVNVEPFVLESSGLTKFRMKQTPGVVQFASVSGAPRGSIQMGGDVYVVHGTSLVHVNSAGVTTSLGSVPGSDRVSMACNGRYVVIANGSDGYYYDTTALVFAQITDADFQAADKVLYLDGYFVFHATGTDNVFISGLNDPTSYDATEVQAKGGTADELVTIHAVNGDLLLLGGGHSYFWRNIGNLDFPFQSIEGAEMERGCPALHSVAGIDNSVIFLGDDRVVYWVEGYVPKRVSNIPLEEYLTALTAEEVAAAYGFAYTQGGQYYYVLTVGDRTWCYNRTQSLLIQQNLWHERSSGDSTWLAQTHIFAFGKHLVGADDNLYELSTSAYTEDGETINRVRTIAPIWAADEIFSIGKLRLVMKVGTGSLTDPPEIDLETSSDMGKTWGDPKTRTTGLLGEYGTTVIWRRLGRSDNRVFRFSWSSDADIELYGLFVDAA